MVFLHCREGNILQALAPEGAGRQGLAKIKGMFWSAPIFAVTSGQLPKDLPLAPVRSTVRSTVDFPLE